MPGSGVWSVKEADADQYRVMVTGVAISKGAGQSGYTDGEFLNVAPARPIFESVEGTDGSISWSATNSRLLKIKLVLAQTSGSNAFLSSLTLKDQNKPNGAGIGSFIVEDLQGTTLLLCSRSRITNWPDFTLNRTSQPRSWAFEAVWDTYVVGGN